MTAVLALALATAGFALTGAPDPKARLLGTALCLAAGVVVCRRRKTRAAISRSAPPQVVAQECTGGGWHVHRPIKPVRPGVLTDREPCRAYARRLHQHDGDWRINSDYVAGETVARDKPCGVCERYGRCGQVHIAWSPAGRANTDQVDACTGCAPEYLQSVVSVDAGDCDVHTDLIDVEVRRVA